MTFFQEGPGLKNQFTDDQLLQEYLSLRLPPKVAEEVFPHLREVGEKVSTELMEWAKEAEANPPKLIQYDAWGKRIDKIEVTRAWQDLNAFSAIHGIVASAYERKYSEFSRIYQMTLLYLFHPSSAIASCPLAMTDGAARAIELYGDEDMKKRAFKHLTSRDPNQFWTSGQWMTEKTGGSDVGKTETIAKKTNDNYELFGAKWFTSATTSQMAMTLARIEGAPEGGKGLSLFYLETNIAQEKRNGIEIIRLKDKLGTRALPTAELNLHGTKARLVGDEGHGIKKIASLFNITRVYNSVCAVGHMRRGLAMAFDYASKREAFGKKLIDHPLHMKTLKSLELEWKGSFHFTFKVVELLGKDECGKTNEQEKALLRMLTPMVKLFTAKAVVMVASEVLESFGGAGYIEDTGLPRFLRDGQVMAIWEGTTNVLSLDMIRAIQKEKGLQAFSEDLKNRISSLKNENAKLKLTKRVEEVSNDFQKTLGAGELAITERAREFAFIFSRLYISSLMFEYADQTRSDDNLKAAESWSFHQGYCV
ncbi:MAG: acyl-CoA dehydrogenase family protein [Bdellovibrionota bacterium]